MLSPQSGGEKKIDGGLPPQPSMTAIRRAIFNLFARPPPKQCPHRWKLNVQNANSYQKMQY
jgi:hypothetical protein